MKWVKLPGLTICVLVVVLSLGSASLVYAAEASSKDPNIKPKEEASTKVEVSAVQMTGLATQLARLGRETESVEMLVAAAKLLAQGSPQPTEREKTTTEQKPDAQGADTTEKKVQPSLDAKALLDEAYKFAGNDETLKALVDRQRSQTQQSMGRVGGPAIKQDCVLAGHTDVYTITFRGGENAEIIVSGDGDTDLDLYVYDENGNLVESDTDYTDDCIVEWLPKWTGPFRVEIVNLGRVANCYTLITN